MVEGSLDLSTAVSVEHFQEDLAINPADLSLSPHELRTLFFLAEGLQSRQIAAAIGRRKPTVEGYIRMLCLKFRARSRAHLVARAFASGILTR